MNKKIVAINSCNYGSTGNIMIDILKTAEKDKMITLACYPKSRRTMKKFNKKKHYYIGGLILRNISLRLSVLTGFSGCFSFFDTLKTLVAINHFKPDVIHLHNLHDAYINIPLLFKYIKKQHVRVIWTLHDCWAFTGHCPHFIITNCQKWKKGCNHCPSYKEYPVSIFDNSSFMWRLKKKWFSGIEDLTIVTPSNWLSDLVKQSFLNQYPVRVINNGIDLDVFKPIKNDFRSKYKLDNKYILLGVAFSWGNRKGLDVFIELSRRLDECFVIVLVGTNDEIDKLLPDNIISIHKTQNQNDLAKIYSAADLFVNPTREENYPTVNMEAIACGTPVLTFRTGGSPEIPDEKTGYVVDVDDIDELEKQIVHICTNKIFSKADCLERAKLFDKNKKFCEYVELYR